MQHILLKLLSAQIILKIINSGSVWLPGQRTDDRTELMIAVLSQVAKTNAKAEDVWQRLRGPKALDGKKDLNVISLCNESGSKTSVSAADRVSKTYLKQAETITQATDSMQCSIEKKQWTSVWRWHIELKGIKDSNDGWLALQEHEIINTLGKEASSCSCKELHTNWNCFDWWQDSSHCNGKSSD